MTFVRPSGRHSQFHDLVEGVNPGKRIGNRNSDHFEIPEVETARVMGGGVGRIREGVHPRFESGSGQTELDVVEKVYSGPRNPRLGNEATFPERGGFIVQMVDDEVEDLWREEGRHRGSHRNGADRRSYKFSTHSSPLRFHNRSRINVSQNLCCLADV